jgi:Penicillin binding protein transpeptidase domain
VTSDWNQDRSFPEAWYRQDSATAAYRGAPPEPSGPGRRKRSRSFIVAVTAGVVAVVAAIAVVIVTVVLPHKTTSTTGFLPTGTSPGQDARQTTAAFVQAWRKGNLGQAGRYTDHPFDATAALKAYRKYLHLGKLTGTASTARAETTSASSAPRETVTLEIKATVSATDGTKTVTGQWSYHSSLVAYQQLNSQLWYIAWAPDDLAPNLTANTHLATVAVAPQVTAVTDSSGNNLASYGDPGLTTIAGLLKQGDPAPGQGSPGLDVEIQTAAGTPLANSQAVIIPPVNVPSAATTINPQAEAAARSAVAEHGNSAMVAIQPSTGQVLAIANNDGFNDFALTAAVAPGSTGKIISSTALFANNVLTANTDVACPLTYTVQGITYHNDNNETEPASTPLTTDFAQSCNNAFDQWWPDLTNGRLAAAAKEYYGLDEPWDIGLGRSATYYNTPAGASGSELAEEAFGEGQITASPLAMASVAATIDTGTFKQPIVVPGISQISATPLPAGTDAGLKQMMRAVVTSGTAAGLGFGPDVYAKTGTADVTGQGQPNSWFVAFDPSQNIAVACLVLNSGYGAQFAAPEVQSFLSQF